MRNIITSAVVSIFVCVVILALAIPTIQSAPKLGGQFNDLRSYFNDGIEAIGATSTINALSVTGSPLAVSSTGTTTLSALSSATSGSQGGCIELTAASTSRATLRIIATSTSHLTIQQGSCQ